MINLLVLFSLAEWWESLNIIPKTFSDMAPAHWIIAVLILIFILILAIKLWQKFIMFIIKILIVVCLALLAYFLVISV